MFGPFIHPRPVRPNRAVPEQTQRQVQRAPILTGHVLVVAQPAPSDPPPDRRPDQPPDQRPAPPPVSDPA